MSDSMTLAQSKEAEARWKADYERLVARFGDQTPERATAPTTDSGLPIKSCYFPHDVAHIPFEEMRSSTIPLNRRRAIAN